MEGKDEISRQQYSNACFVCCGAGSRWQARPPPPGWAHQGAGGQAERAGCTGPAPQHTMRREPWETGEASSVQAVWCYSAPTSPTTCWWGRRAVGGCYLGCVWRGQVLPRSPFIPDNTSLNFTPSFCHSLLPISSPRLDFMADL